jgi:protein ImuB
VVLAAPTLELRLQCHELVRTPAPNGELFPTRQSQSEGLTRLLERLRARLGDAQVLRVVPLADHRPERACELRPVAQPAAAALPPPNRNEEHLPLHQPVWLLPVPRMLAERDAMPLLEGRPLQLLSGPERIESGWWDGELVTRDYFIAQAGDGSLVWLFRNRLPSEAGGWFLQGQFG